MCDKNSLDLALKVQAAYDNYISDWPLPFSKGTT